MRINQMVAMQRKLTLAASLLLAASLQGCFSSEDETELEASEPVEAEEGAAPAPAAAEPQAPVATPPVAPPPPSSIAPVEAPTSPPVPVAPQIGGSESRRVMYVKTANVPIYEKADTKSKVVGRADKGDHFLVDIEGKWARTPNGQYISISSLSEKGIGRGKRPGVWTNPDGTKSKPTKAAPPPTPSPSAAPGGEPPSEATE